MPVFVKIDSISSLLTGKLFSAFLLLPIWIQCFVPFSIASYCGQSAIPFSLEIRPNGQPVLGCARPRCFGWTPDGKQRAADAAQFYKVWGRPDGYVRLADLRRTQSGIGGAKGVSEKGNEKEETGIGEAEYSICERKYARQRCASNEWVGGIDPSAHIDQAHPLKLLCCSYAKLSTSKPSEQIQLRGGQILQGGELMDARGQQETGFEYIANLQRLFDREGVVYVAEIRKFACGGVPNKQQSKQQQQTKPKTTSNIEDGLDDEMNVLADFSEYEQSLMDQDVQDGQAQFQQQNSINQIRQQENLGQQHATAASGIGQRQQQQQQVKPANAIPIDEEEEEEQQQKEQQEAKDNNHLLEDGQSQPLPPQSPQSFPIGSQSSQSRFAAALPSPLPPALIPQNQQPQQQSVPQQTTTALSPQSAQHVPLRPSPFGGYQRSQRQNALYYQQQQHSLAPQPPQVQPPRQRQFFYQQQQMPQQQRLPWFAQTIPPEAKFNMNFNMLPQQRTTSYVEQHSLSRASQQQRQANPPLNLLPHLPIHPVNTSPIPALLYPNGGNPSAAEQSQPLPALAIPSPEEIENAIPPHGRQWLSNLAQTFLGLQRLF